MADPSRQLVSKMFFHSVPVANGLVHETCVFLEGGQYVHYATCHPSGREHARFFETLADFVKWHYRSQGHVILDENFRFESEVKGLILFPTVDDISVDMTRPIQHMDLECLIIRGSQTPWDC
jgi:hypothetical protein